MRAASYETAFRLLFLLSSEHAPEDRPNATQGWVLVPFDLATGTPQAQDGEVLNGIHEDLIEADPTGRICGTSRPAEARQSADGPQEVRPRPVIADGVQRPREGVCPGQTVFSGINRR
jgi:hypothetical protein